MMNGINQALLLAISNETTSPLVSMLATALTVDQAQCDERLSILIHQSVASGKPVSEVMTVLIEIDEALQQRGGEIPCATRLAPLAAELITHAQSRHFQDNQQREAAESSPIFFVSRRTAVASAGHLTHKAAFSRFSDRLLAVVMKHRVKKVLLHLPNHEAEDDVIEAVTLLLKDLESQRVRVEVVSSPE